MLTDGEIERVYLDEGYRGHDAPKRFWVYRSGQTILDDLIPILAFRKTS